MNETGRPQDFPLSNPRADRVRDVAKLAGRPARLKRGQILAEGSRDQDELIVADLDMDKIREVRNTWQFFRDRRPDAYGPIVAD